MNRENPVFQFCLISRSVSSVLYLQAELDLCFHISIHLTKITDISKLYSVCAMIRFRFIEKSIKHNSHSEYEDMFS